MLLPGITMWALKGRPPLFLRDDGGGGRGPTPSPRRRVADAIAARAARPRLGMVAVPLTITAATLLTLWILLVPLAGLAWWWSPREWRWSWLVPVQGGIAGTEWAYVGVVLLAEYPAARPLVGAGWSGAAALFAAWAARNRHAYGGPWLELGP